MPARAPLVALAFVGAGCASGQPAAPVAPVAAPVSPPPAVVRVPAPPGTYALVWWDAPLHRAPDARSPMIRAYAPLAVRKPGQVMTDRVIAEHGPWVEIESGGTGTVCHPAAGALSAVRLTLFVRAADITPAITVGQDLRWPDRSRVSFPAGIHALPGGPPVDGVVTVLLGGDGVAVPVQLPVGDIAAWWSPERGPAWAHTYSLDLAAAPTIRERALVDLQRWPGGRVGFCGTLVPKLGDPASVAGPVGPGRRVRHASSTARLVGPTTTRYVPTRGCPACVVAAGFRRVSYRLPGPALTWEDGTPAGVSLADVDVHDVAPAPAEPGRTCFTIEPAPRATPLHAPAPRLALRLCAPREAVRTPTG